MQPLSRFLLLVQYWKGQQVIRSGPSKTTYHLFFDVKIGDDNLLHFAVFSDPTATPYFSAMLVPCPDPIALDRGSPNENQDYLLPDENSFWNDSKDTYSWVEKIDSGNVVVKRGEDGYKFIFMGKKFKGIFEASKELVSKTDKVNLWVFKSISK